jgi:exonuclease VII small subunit
MTLDPLFPSETSDQLTSQMQTMDELLRGIQQVLMDLRRFCEDRSDLERRVDELERTVNRLNSTIMDLRSGSSTRQESGDRLFALEQMVARLTQITEQQKESRDHQAVDEPGDLGVERNHFSSPQSEEEPVIQEIDELMRRRT